MSAGPALSAVAPLPLAEPADEPGLGDYARRVWRRRGFVARVTLGAGAAAAVLSLVLPPTFEAITTVIPAPTPGRNPGVDQLSAQAQELGLATGAQPNRAAMYPDIVRSRRLLERLLATRFAPSRGTPAPLIDLIQRPGPTLSRLELAVKKLRRSVDATLDRRTGVLTLRVRSRDPGIAAGVANALFALLQDYTVHSMASQAGENRKFIEGRLADARRDLARAEDALRMFRENNLRFGNSPHLLLQQGRLLRDMRAQEEIFLTLTRQYELAKVEEQRDVPVLNVLDAAAEPAFRVAPRRTTMTAFGLLLGTALAAAWVIARPATKSRE